MRRRIIGPLSVSIFDRFAESHKLHPEPADQLQLGARNRSPSRAGVARSLVRPLAVEWPLLKV